MEHCLLWEGCHVVTERSDSFEEEKVKEVTGAVCDPHPLTLPSPYSGKEVAKLSPGKDGRMRGKMFLISSCFSLSILLNQSILLLLDGQFDRGFVILIKLVLFPQSSLSFPHEHNWKVSPLCP